MGRHSEGQGSSSPGHWQRMVCDVASKEVVVRGQKLPCQADYARHTVGTSRKIPARDSPEGEQVTDIPRSVVFW